MRNFFYQIGNVTTTKGWSKPTYESVQSFLRDATISHILEKYDDVLLNGGFLYEKDTWDLDLYCILNWNDNTDWVAVEADMDLLNDTALNKHNLLLDVSISRLPNIFMSKQELIVHNKGKTIEDFNFPRSKEDDGLLIKLGKVLKMANGNTYISYDLSIEPVHERYGIVKKLTPGHLYLMDRKKMNHRPKLTELVMKTMVNNIIRNLRYKTFLDMTRQDYLNSRNKLNEKI